MSRGKYHASHRYKKVRGRTLSSGKKVANINISGVSFDNISELARKRDISFMAMCGELLEFALMELEEQGEIVLNKFK